MRGAFAWRILSNTENNENKGSGASPTVKAPAASLLFQAPQFVEPAVSAPEPSGKSTSKAAGKAAGKTAGKTASTVEKRSRAKKKTAEADGAKTESQQSVTVEEGAEADSGKSRKPARKAPRRSAKTDAAIEEAPAESKQSTPVSDAAEGDEGTHKRRRRRSRPAGEESDSGTGEVTALKGSTRLEAKRMRRREGRREGQRRQSITEAEFLARRESVDRQMVVRHKDGLDQIAVLEDGLLVEHYVARRTQQSIVGNIYLGRVQNVLPSMEAAFVDIGKGRNAVLYAGEVNWDAVGAEGKSHRIEHALKSGDTVLVQATKDPIGQKGARLTSQITLAGRYLVLVPGSSMLGISRKLPENERLRLKNLLKEIVPKDSGVIVRTAAEGASEEQLRDDVERLTKQWKEIQRKEQGTKKAPQLLRGEPELVVRVVRDIFNEDFNKLIVQGEETWQTVSEYVEDLSPELSARIEKWVDKEDVFHAKKIDQQLSKGMDRKVWLPSGGTLVIDRTEAMTVIDVNTGKFIGSGGTLEETVTKNNLEAAEEIVRQLRLRDIGGIIIVDFVDMVLESNRELVLRRLVECLGRDRTRHQVTEITSLGLVQMTRKRVGEGLVEAFSVTCEACEGRGFIVQEQPVEIDIQNPSSGSRKRKESRGSSKSKKANEETMPQTGVGDEKVKTALSAIAAATVPAETTPEPAVKAEKPAKTSKSGAQQKTSKTKKAVTVEPVKDAKVEETQERPKKGRRVAKLMQEDTGKAKHEPIKEIKQIDLSAVQQQHEAATAVESKPSKRRRRVVSTEDVPVKKTKTRKVKDSKDSPESEEKLASAQQAVKDLLGN